MVVERPAPVGLRQACHCTKSEFGSSPTWRRARVLSGFFQADLQSQGHGCRQPPPRQRAGLYRGVSSRAFLVAPAARRPREQRPRRGRRRAALVAARARHHWCRRNVRLLAGRGRAQCRGRRLVRVVVPQAPRRIHRHGQSRDHRRAHHRGPSALRRPMARSLRRQALGRSAGAALPGRRLALRRFTAPRRLQHRAVHAAWPASRACRSPFTRTGRPAGTPCRRAASGWRSSTAGIALRGTQPANGCVPTSPVSS